MTYGWNSWKAIQSPPQLFFVFSNNIEIEVLNFRSNYFFQSSLHELRQPSADGSHIHVNNRPKFKLRPSISWTVSNVVPRLPFWGERRPRTGGRISTIDRPPHRRIWTVDHDNLSSVKKVDDRRSKFPLDGRKWTNRPSTLWTDLDDSPWLFAIGGRRWTVDKMDRPPHEWIRIIKNILMWTEVDRWTKVRP